MIHIVLGTKAQIIKMAPVVHALAQAGTAFRVIDTGQHAAAASTLYPTLGMRPPDFGLDASNADVDSTMSAAKWLARLRPWFRSSRTKLRRNVFAGGDGVCLVHGDTLSTLVGLLLARRAGLSAALVEAGLSSDSFAEPFPEEIIRRFAETQAVLLFAPGDQPAALLKQRNLPGEIVNIHSNTTGEALARVLAKPASTPLEPYAVALCHRAESLFNRSRLRRIVNIILSAAARLPLIMVLQPSTRHALEKAHLMSTLAAGGVDLRPLEPYPDFIALLAHADFVLSDGGSVQEECACLGVPCLILRSTTERQDGLGQNVLLSGLDPSRVQYFLHNYPRFRRAPQPLPLASAVIAERLKDI